MEERFAAEPMLGKLAKWLRMIGCDVLYLRSYREEDLLPLLDQGRRLLSRRTLVQGYGPGVILIRSDRVSEQLKELQSLGCIYLDRSKFFTRCLRCNVPLKDASPEAARSSVPEHVYHENPSGIRCCPQCGRFFWPGTHRDRMLTQLARWGL
ncbi:MAG: Mut7-C RNAse domain-containing protein [Deltaproteobacteria bacterium]